MSMAESFLLDPANESYASGTSRQVKTAIPIAGMMILGLFCFGGLIAVLLLGREWAIWNQFRRAPMVNAVVTKVDFYRSGRNTNTRFSYSFKAPDPQGRVQTYSANYSTSGTHRTYRIGGPLTIHYLPSNPTRTRPNFAMSPLGLLFFSVVAGGFTLFVWWRLFDSFAVGRLEKRLAEGSILLPGEVVSCDGVIQTEEHYTNYDLVMRYRFVSPQGKELSGYVTQQRNDLRGQILPARGTPLAIAYIDDDHYKVL